MNHTPSLATEQPERRPAPWVWAAGVACLALMVVVAAQGSAQERDRSSESGRPLLVLAASSLTDVLPAIGEAWTRSEVIEGRPNPSVRFSFDATSRLAPQAASGAPADVLLSADEAWVQWLRERRLVVDGTLRLFAGNELVLVVPVGAPRPSAPTELSGLGRIAVGGENVPAGRYAREALRRTGVLDSVTKQLVTGGSARGVLEWVARGEVDGGVVYRTDALAEPRVELAFAFPSDSHPAIGYWATVLTSSGDPQRAASFVDFLASEGRTALTDAGFTLRADGASASFPGGSVQAPSAQAAIGATPSVGSAIRLSLLVALLSTLFGFVPAVALGWLLARHDFRGKTLVSTLVLAPLVMPPVVTGFLLLSLLGSQSLLGSALSGLGLAVPFTLLGATLAAFVVGMPLYVLSVRGAFEAVDPLYEELSWTLGVPPRRTFLRVSLPLALPGIAAGAILAFARALGEFGATVVLAGNVEGSTRTIALAVYTLLESPSGRQATWVLVGASVALSLLALVGFEALSRRQRWRVRDEHGG